MKSTVVAALGGLLFGFDTAVIAGTTDALTEFFSLSPAVWGSPSRSRCGARSSDRWWRAIRATAGVRRDSLRIMAVLYFVSAVGMRARLELGLARDSSGSSAGLGIGGSSVLGPMYIAEIAPAKLARPPGRLLPVQRRLRHPARVFSNYLVGLMHSAPTEWRWKLGVSAVPAACFLLMLFGIPRSPRWLAQSDRIDEALHVLKLIGEENPEAELADIVKAVEERA